MDSGNPGRCRGNKILSCESPFHPDVAAAAAVEAEAVEAAAKKGGKQFFFISALYPTDKVLKHNNRTYQLEYT
jgi:hypothetical protein